MSQNNNDKDSKKLLDKKPVEGGEMKKGGPEEASGKGAKDAKKDPKAPKEEELVRMICQLIDVSQRKIFS